MTMTRIPNNPSKDKVNNFLAVTNAYAEQLRQKGEDTEFLRAKNASEVYEKILKLCVSTANESSPTHLTAINSIKTAFPNSTREAVDKFRTLGENIIPQVRKISESFVKNGYTTEQAVSSAFNSLAGNPVYDYFGNLSLLSEQLKEEMTFVQSFIDSGDAFNMPVENGIDGSSMSRFRSPSEKISGSSKTAQGDINPQGQIFDDSNKVSISLFSEFKNVKFLTQGIDLTSFQRDQILMYENAVSPALAGFLIQQRLIESSEDFLMKLAELAFVGGLDHRQDYIPNVGGSYGLLSEPIMLTLADNASASPNVATNAEWESNPTKLIQKITNHFYKPVDVATQLPLLDSADMYKEIVRLLGLPASANINFENKEWELLVPSSFYKIATQYPTGGTFNKQLQEMVDTAVSGSIVKKVTVKTSSLLNYGANIGTKTNAYNYMVLRASGSPTGKKPVILPTQTTRPTVVALPSSSSLLSFKVNYVTGGAMVKQYGGCFILEFSNADS